MMISYHVVIRGTQIAYYVICKTKLWLFSHFVTMEHTSDIVREGHVLHDIYYQRENKEININNEISVDIIKNKDGVEIREIKKSSKMEKAHEYQIKYYMYYLSKRGINVKRGIILYPNNRKIKEVKLEKTDSKQIENIINEIKTIISLDKPPFPIYKSYCKKCSYYALCFG